MLMPPPMPPPILISQDGPLIFGPFTLTSHDGHFTLTSHDTSQSTSHDTSQDGAFIFMLMPPSMPPPILISQDGPLIFGPFTLTSHDGHFTFTSHDTSQSTSHDTSQDGPFIFMLMPPPMPPPMLISQDGPLIFGPFTLISQDGPFIFMLMPPPMPPPILISQDGPLIFMLPPRLTSHSMDGPLIFGPLISTS